MASGIRNVWAEGTVTSSCHMPDRINTITRSPILVSMQFIFDLFQDVTDPQS